MIYFLRFEVEASPVKIGYTQDRRRLAGRLRHYSSHSPWEVEGLAYADGGHALESTLHLMFAPWRMRGEWFEPVEPILRLAAWCRNNPGATPGETTDKALALVRAHGHDPLTAPGRRGRMARKVERGIGRRPGRGLDKARKGR